MGKRQSDSRIRLVKTAYFDTDLIKARQFLEAFGLEAVHEEQMDGGICFTGYGMEPYCYVARQSTSGNSEFRGAALVVKNRGELEHAARFLGATPICILGAPRGGETVTLRFQWPFDFIMSMDRQRNRHRRIRTLH